MAGEGGKGALRTCIQSSQNSGAQGKLFNKFVRNCSPGRGKKFIIRMKGGCNYRNGKRDDAAESTDSPRHSSAERRADDGSTAFNASSNVLYSWENNTYMYIPFENLRDGHYSLNLAFSGSVNSLQVLDSQGDSYLESNLVAKGNNFGFDVGGLADAGDDGLPAGLFLDVDKAIDVSYKATAKLNGTTTKSKSQAPDTALPFDALTLCGATFAFILLNIAF